MKTLIIPDIHCMYAEAEGIISKENADHIVFTGDFFDRYDTDPTLTTKVAQWLKESLKKNNRTHLLGNHELWYCSNNDLLKCSGNTESKYQAIRREDIDWNKFVLNTWVGDWLITHAGLSADYYKIYGLGTDVKKFIDQESKEAMDMLIKGKDHRLFQVSYMRGGTSEIAGTLWCDFREFKPIRYLNQIFGHTHMEKPDNVVIPLSKLSKGRTEYDSMNWCIDSAGWYAVYENSRMEIKHELG